MAAARKAGLRLDAPEVRHLGELVGVGDGRVDHWTARFARLAIGGEIIAAIGDLYATQGKLAEAKAIPDAHPACKLAQPVPLLAAAVDETRPGDD